jgi:hypothetical protein
VETAKGRNIYGLEDVARAACTGAIDISCPSQQPAQQPRPTQSPKQIHVVRELY